MEVLAGSVVNLDSGSTRGVDARVNDDGQRMLYRVLRSAVLGIGLTRSFPGADDLADEGGVTGGARMIVSGEMELHLQLEAVAAAQDGDFAFTAEIRGGFPTVTEVGNSTPTITINTEKVF